MAGIKRVCQFLGVVLGLASGAAIAGSVPLARGVPTLDELALYGLAAAVGAAGVFALLRRRK